MEFQDVFKQIQHNYIIQLLEDLDEVEELVLDLEKEGLKEKEFRELQGKIHTIKGSAGTFELDLITTLCHNYEDHLSNLVGDSFKNLSELSLNIIDLMKEYVNEFLKNENVNVEPFKKKMSGFFVCEFNPGGEGPAFVPRPRFLVNENYNVMNKLITGVLMDLNMDSHYSRTGYEALGRMIEENFDGLITSLDTPRIDGIRLAKMIRIYKDKNNSKFKIILITSKNVEKIPEIDFIIKKDKDIEKNLIETLKKIS
jgi:HPt (histidine-containing phosphotransfer) domain-containing protein/CheY-like chemotaxis protein